MKEKQKTKKLMRWLGSMVLTLAMVLSMMSFGSVTALAETTTKQVSFDTDQGKNSYSNNDITINVYAVGDSDGFYLGGESDYCTITAAEGYYIKKVELTVGWYSSNVHTLTTTNGTLSGNTSGSSFVTNTEINASSVTYTSSSALQFNKVTVYYEDQIDISGCTVSTIGDQMYTGSQITPELTVTYGQTALVKDTDYTLEYGGNINAAEDGGSVIVKGKNGYKGSQTVNFNITKSNALKIFKYGTTEEFGDRTYEFVYNGKRQWADAMIASISQGDPIEYLYSEDGGKTWKKQVSSNGIRWGRNYAVKESILVKMESPNYETATASFSYTVSPAKLTIALDSTSFVYNGEEQAPKVTVKGVDDTELKADDYQIIYEQTERMDVGTYGLEVTAKNYETSDKAYYTIAPTEITVELSQEVFYYDGQAHVPAYTVKGVDGAVLSEGEDYHVEIAGGVEAKQIEAGEVELIFYADNANYKDAKASYQIIQIKVTDGGNQTIDVSAGEDTVFRSNAELPDFVNITIDDKVVDSKNYTTASGSTIVTLKNAYLKTLTNGEHTLSIVSTVGTADTTFVIENSPVVLWIVLAAAGAVLVAVCGVLVAIALKKKKARG